MTTPQFNISENNQKPILEVKNLHVSYGGIQAIRGISFYVNTGEVVSLVGSNGAGKTTTLRAISGMVPYRGEILLNGQSINEISSAFRIRQGLAQSPEGRGVFPNLKVWENLDLGAYIVKDQNQIQEDLTRCYELFPRLKERKDQLAGTLSGGEQQMLAICRALMSRPKVLLLDEPSLGLAPIIVAQIFEIVDKLNSEGMTVLLVEQNARMALKHSHRAYVIETGNVVLSGKGSELLDDDSVKRAYLGM